MMKHHSFTLRLGIIGQKQLLYIYWLTSVDVQATIAFRCRVAPFVSNYKISIGFIIRIGENSPFIVVVQLIWA